MGTTDFFLSKFYQECGIIDNIGSMGVRGLTLTPYQAGLAPEKMNIEFGWIR